MAWSFYLRVWFFGVCINYGCYLQVVIPREINEFLQTIISLGMFGLAYLLPLYRFNFSLTFLFTEFTIK